MPAFYTLAEQKLLPENYLLIGNGRGDVSHEDSGSTCTTRSPSSAPRRTRPTGSEFSARVRFAGGGFTVDDPGEPARRRSPRRAPSWARKPS